MKSYRTALGESVFTQSILKSKFIAYLSHVETEEEAESFIKSVSKKHSDATHNCYAYILKHGNLGRSNDDGEPSGTAGMPIYNAIKGDGLLDVAIVVTRYFGGTLLGTGGLVRAYGSSAKGAIDGAEIVTMEETDVYDAAFDYRFLDKINAFVEKDENLKIVNTDYGEKITMRIQIKNNNFDAANAKITDITSNNFVINFIKNGYFPW